MSPSWRWGVGGGLLFLLQHKSFIRQRIVYPPSRREGGPTPKDRLRELIISRTNDIYFHNFGLSHTALGSPNL